MSISIESDPRRAVNTFIDGFAHIQRLCGPVGESEQSGIRFLTFARGRRLGRFAHEFFPHDVSPVVMLDVAREHGSRPHMISVLGLDGGADIPSYLSAGYERWGQETVMERGLDGPIPLSTEVEVRAIDDLDTANRIVDAQRSAGLNSHPIFAAHLEDSALRQGWVEVDGEVAAFGRVALVEDSAYLADVVALPAFRRRGCADALVRALLEDARHAGARRCVLTSTEMALNLYRTLGFSDAVQLTGFETPKPA